MRTPGDNLLARAGAFRFSSSSNQAALSDLLFGKLSMPEQAANHVADERPEKQVGDNGRGHGDNVFP